LKRWTRILYVLAMEEKPLNPYKVWNKLVKEEVATQPTIRGDLEDMLQKTLVKTVDTDQKARGGRPSEYYDLTLLGLASVVCRYDELGNKVEDPHQFASHVAKKYRDLLPPIFDLWPEFVREKVNHLAWRELQAACGFADVNKISSVEEAEDVYWFFFHHISVAVARPTNPNDNAWLQAVVRNQTIRETLVGFELNELSERIERANEFLRLLPDHSCDEVKTGPKELFRGAFLSFLEHLDRVEVRSTTADG
jgi:hypothetical protein